MENRIIRFKLYKDGVLMGTVELESPNGIIDMAYEWDIACQFTGLLDRDGNEIYEGDIIGYGDNYPCEVKYDSEECQFLAHEYGNKDGLRVHSMTAYTVKWKVLGNIYKNKELLSPIKV